MAKWGGEADAAVETAGGGGGNFVPAPRGIYTIQVVGTKDGTTKESRRPKVDLECEIVEEGEHFGKKVWLTITHLPKGEKGHGCFLDRLSSALVLQMRSPSPARETRESITRTVPGEPPSAKTPPDAEEKARMQVVAENSASWPRRPLAAIRLATPWH